MLLLCSIIRKKIDEEIAYYMKAAADHILE